MRENTSYATGYRPEDPAADEIRQLDWQREPEQAIKDAGALIAEAMEDEFVDPIKEAEAEDWLNLDTTAEPDPMAGFRHAMAHDGLAASYQAGERLQELLGNVPEEHRTETLDHLSSTYAPPAGRIDRELALAYRRERIILEGLNWPEPDPVQEKALLDAVGEATYREIQASRELLQEAAYLCATPNQHGPKDLGYFLNGVHAAYRHTLHTGEKTPEQVRENALGALELAGDRIDFLTNLHLTQATSQLDDPSTQERILETRALLDANHNLSSAERLSATLELTKDTLRQTDDGAATGNLEMLAMLARNCADLRRENAVQYDRVPYAGLNDTDRTELNAYATLRELRAMGYQDETQVIEQMGSANWNEAMTGLRNMAAVTTDYAAAEKTIELLGKHEDADWVRGRWDLLEKMRLTNENPNQHQHWYPDAAAATIAEFRVTDHHDLSEKLEQLMRDSQACNAVRLATEPREVIQEYEMPWNQHDRYAAAAGRIPEIVRERDLLPESVDTPQTDYEPVAHEVNRMGYRLLTEIQENLHFQQAQASQLARAARDRGLDAAVVDLLAKYNETVCTEQAAQHGVAPTRESVQSAGYGAAVTLALDNAVKQGNEEFPRHLLDQLERYPYLAYASALSSLDPIIRDGVMAANAAATMWNNDEIADGAVEFPVNYAELEWQNTDGGRREWIIATGQESKRTWLSGDCTVRALTEATGNREGYGEIWQELTEAKQAEYDTTSDADRGVGGKALLDIYKDHGMHMVYDDQGMPTNEAKLEIDLREVPTALQHLFGDSESPLTYIAAIGSHVVAVRGNQLLDTWDSRQAGEAWYSRPAPGTDYRDRWGKLRYLWVQCEADQAQEVTQTFERYAKQRRHDAT